MTSLHGSPATSPVVDTTSLSTTILGAQADDHDESIDLNALTKDDVLLQIPTKLDAGEEQLRSLSHKPHEQASASTSTASSDDDESSSGPEDKPDEQPWPMPVSARVAMCNYPQFKNAVTTENTRCTIEALLWTPTLESDIDNFMASLDNRLMRRSDLLERSKSLDVSDTEALNAFPPNETWIQEVRVNSHAVLSVLERFAPKKNALANKPHIFRRPFLYLFENYKNVREELQKVELQRRPSATSTQHSAATQEIFQSMETSDRYPETRSMSLEDEGSDSDIARIAEELQCYCNFVKNYIMPKYQALQDDAFARTQKIHFDDLEFIFRPGELLYVPASATKLDELRSLSAQRRSSGEQRIVRLKYLTRVEGLRTTYDRRPAPLHASGGYFSPDRYRSNTRYGLNNRMRPTYDTDTRDPEKCRAFCYYIEFDGESYGAIGYDDLEIPFFHEARHITELPFQPARLMVDYEEILKEAKEHGEKMVNLLSDSARHAHYSGWTMTNGPLGSVLEDSKGKLVKFPEHIESDIIVDYDEAFKHNPGWKPSGYSAGPNKADLGTAIDSAPLVKWSTSPPYDMLAKYEDYRVELDPIRDLQWNEYLETDVYCKENAQSHTPVRPEDLALLPRRMFAYSLWDRKFVQVDSRLVNSRALEGQEGQSFEQLQIEQRSKDMIESLLYSHFSDMKAEKAGIVVESQDLIRGKGRGVSILLHGKPGVGKTATAEAVAEKWKRPLFPITCGDLGYEADTVERSLNDIFRLAHLWGCVLLLDEADIFITQRTNQELQRNALVSVFLRMLEYYNGILFLTTNRTGVLDEAIKSRIHLHLGFDDLNEHQTVEIFKNNIVRLRTRDQQRMKAMPGHRALMIDEGGILEFARKHYQTHSTAMGRWNGRQIRNAFVVASSLANFEAEKHSPDWQPQLRAEHFNKVLSATLDYDRYRQSIHMVSDDAMAFSRMERAEPTAPPPLSGNYGFVQNGALFSSQQQQPQQQQAGVPISMQYGGAAGAAAAHATMPPPSTGSFPYNTGFTHSAHIPEQAQAGLYSGQPAVRQVQPVLNTHTQDQMYSQHGQPGFDLSTSAQSLGGSQEQGPINPGGSSNLRPGVVEPMYTGNLALGQEQGQTLQMQYGSVEGAHGRASGGGFQGRP